MKWLAGALLVGLLAACGGAGERRPADDFENLETEDIGDAFDAGLSTEEDRKGRPPRDPEVAGVLPGGFPGDIPLFRPSSIVDFGELDGGRHFVEIDTSAPVAAVRAELERSLAGSGWAREGAAASGGPGRLVKAGRVLGLALTDLSPGTRIRYEY
jgi:hypothetical protein